MSPIARVIQIVLILSGFATLGTAAVWELEEDTQWRCWSQTQESMPVQYCDATDGRNTTIILGMAGLALEIAGVSVAVGARRRDNTPAQQAPVIAPTPGPGPLPHIPAAPQAQ
ncbi:hypothetical protein J7I98_37610 [Streptomyces sp. ISL-98]|uniref:hypothetical protein n=1 Tax=Streptomyces sp. ISL-98 TaxID=2819192 RepID=UPI001BE8AE32|nr:hypothetical protein [Streptomyces sp. ISL-98]MBT2511426.1 hypothetical protein [Streptomyces sp. ISL-98]